MKRYEKSQNCFYVLGISMSKIEIFLKLYIVGAIPSVVLYHYNLDILRLLGNSEQLRTQNTTDDTSKTKDRSRF